MRTCAWLTYVFTVCSYDGEDGWEGWRGVPGVYIFAGTDAIDQWYPVYIGQAAELAEQITAHERWQEAQQLGASHVHVVSVPREADREAIEAELLRSYRPPLNQAPPRLAVKWPSLRRLLRRFDVSSATS